MHLALDDHRVDPHPAVVHRDEPADVDLAGARVHVDHADVGAERVGQVGRVVDAGRVQLALDAVGQLQVGVRGPGDLGDRPARVRVALDRPAAALPLQVVRVGLEHGGGHDPGPLAHLPGHDRGGRPGHRRGPGPVGPQAERGLVGVPVHHLHVVRGQAELFGDDLGERGLVPLALGLHRDPEHRGPGRVDAQFHPVRHADAQDVHVLAGTRPDGLGEEADTDSGEVTAGPFGLLFFPEVLVAGHVHGQPQRAGVIAGVVDPPGLAGVGELLGAEQVAHAQFGRVDAELEGEHVDHPLDQVDRLGDAERAGVGDPARRLVGVHARSPGSARPPGRRSR